MEDLAIGDPTHDPVLAPLAADASDELTIGQYQEAVVRAGEKLVSVIVPTNNDKVLLRRSFECIEQAFWDSGFEHEIIVVDDHSSDGTKDYIASLEGELPVRLIEKRGVKGRSISIKEGIDAAIGNTIAIVDPDIRFGKEGFVEMLSRVREAHIVVAANIKYSSFVYGVLSRLYGWILGRLFLSVRVNVHSGIKMFRRSLLESLRFDPEFDPRLGFDAVLLYHARRVGWIISPVPVQYKRVPFHHGYVGEVMSRVSFAYGIFVIKVVHILRAVFPFLYAPPPIEYFNAGFTNVNDYLFLSPTQSAKGHITRETTSLLFFILLTTFVGMYVLSQVFHVPILTGMAFGISVLYLFLITFKFVAMSRSLPVEQDTLSPEDLASVTDEELPVMSVLIPLYKEKEVIPQIFKYLSDFDYPQEKLDIIFILESTDTETAQAFLDMHPPSHFKALLSPDVQPKTKPKAMNVAFSAAKGDILVIFDAEVLPERDQLKRAYLTFKLHPEAGYLHSRMDVYNADENWITRLYTGEFCYFYHYYLPGLVASNFPLPISGHSTYFRREVIEKVGAWDAYNVAEDCDIGIRIYRKGFGSGRMLDTHTWEQSTTTIPTWVRQRTRWIQGFIQTSIVQLRYPLLLKRELKTWRNFVVFLILVPGNVILNILNIFQWMMFALWHTTHAPFLQVAYSGFTLYLATICFVVGNFFFTFYSMYALYKRKHYSTVPWAMLMFAYWIMLGIATIRATIHLFLHPYKWDKTAHFISSQKPQKK